MMQFPPFVPSVPSQSEGNGSVLPMSTLTPPSRSCSALRSPEDFEMLLLAARLLCATFRSADVLVGFGVNG